MLVLEDVNKISVTSVEPVNGGARINKYAGLLAFDVNILFRWLPKRSSL
jgi:hypothetical protein